MKITGIKKASGYTENYPSHSQHRVDLFIDLETGEVWGEYIFGNNTWKQFSNPAIRRFASTTKHMTMREIRERAEEFVAMMEREGYYNG
jgi:hypothetical protein